MSTEANMERDLVFNCTECGKVATRVRVGIVLDAATDQLICGPE